MEKLFNAWSVITGVLGGIAAALFGVWDKLLWALAILMALDYITGIIKGIYTKTLSSDIGYKGILKKAVIFIIVALSHVAEELTGPDTAIREIVVMFYIANEGISILENAAVIMPNMPRKLKEILSQIGGEKDDD